MSASIASARVIWARLGGFLSNGYPQVRLGTGELYEVELSSFSHPEIKQRNLPGCDTAAATPKVERVAAQD